MTKNRLEAFSDGVLAIIVTIMVLEMKVPHEGATFESLKPIFPVFLSYILSFCMVLIYWNNHHHLFQSIKRINGKVLLANGFLLFWLSLMPFTSAWMGENHFASAPVALFGFVLLMAAFAYTLLTNVLINAHSENALLAKAVGNKFKDMISLGSYIIALAVSMFYPLISCGLYGFVAVIWLIPDKRIEKQLEH